MISTSILFITIPLLFRAGSSEILNLHVIKNTIICFSSPPYLYYNERHHFQGHNMSIESPIT
jgi:hypothetical protein